jgi:phage anti-repressor protein
MNRSSIAVFNGTIQSHQAQLVNARDLHSFLKVGKDFSTWIKSRTEEYDFFENQDFIICSPNLGSKQGGHNRKEYHITLSMAKELAMVERTEKGREARRYFIECERVALAKQVEPIRQIPIDLHEKRSKAGKLGAEVRWGKISRAVYSLPAPEKPSASRPGDSITAVFLNMLQSSGFLVDEVQADGELHRAKMAKDGPDECSGTYILSLDCLPLGGLWRGKPKSQWHIWELKSKHFMSEEEIELRQKIINKMNAYIPRF